MSWQDELRKLDESLAAGSLSADEYRTRRDAILSSAVNPVQGEAAQGDAGADSAKIIQPLQQPAGEQPGPPADQNPEATQVVSPLNQGPERTEVVQPWQAQPQGDGQQQQWSASPAGGFPQPAHHPDAPPPGQPWHVGEANASPPWGGSEFPPMAPEPWQTQADPWGGGGESFDDESSKGSGRKVLLSVLAFLVVAGVGVAVWFLFIKTDGQTAGPQNPPPGQSQQQNPPGQSQAPTSEALPEPPPAGKAPENNLSAIVDPPGKSRGGGGAFNMQELNQNQLLPKPVIAALRDNGMKSGVLKASTSGDVTVGIFAIQVRDEQAAVAVAQAYATVQEETGLRLVRDLSLQGVPVYGAENPSSDTLYRSAYVLHDRVVIIDVYGPKADEARQVFGTLLDDQVNHAPPSHRKD